MKFLQKWILLFLLIPLSPFLSVAQTGVADTIVFTPKVKDTIVQVISKSADGSIIQTTQKVKEDGEVKEEKITPTLDLSLLKSKKGEEKKVKKVNVDSLRKVLARQKVEEKKRVAEEAKKKKEEALTKQKIEKEKRILEKQQRELTRLKLEKERKAKLEKRKKEIAELKKAKETERKTKLAAEKKKKELAKIEKEKAQELKKEQEKQKADSLKKLTQIKKEEKKIVQEVTTPNAVDSSLRLSKAGKKKVIKPNLPSSVNKPNPNDTLLSKNPLGKEQKDNNYGTVRLAYDDLATSFLLSIPTETKMHYHKDHSEHIMLIEGQGMVIMGAKAIKLRKNELLFITKGTPHKIINKGKSKLKVLSIQSPFYDGTDKIILE